MPVSTQAPNYGVGAPSTLAGASTKTTGPVVLYPRAHVVAKFIFNDGSEATTGMIPNRACVTIRPHHQCGTCEVEFNVTAAPFDLRRLNGIFLSVFMGAVERADADVQDMKYLQFVGYADVQDVRRGPHGTTVRVSARDMSGLLRELKPMYVKLLKDGTTIDPTPRYTDTITGAIQRVLEWAQMADGQFEIEDRSGRGSVTLTDLTSDRGVEGCVPIRHRDVSAWEAIEHVAAVANVLVSVELGKIVLRNPADAFALPTDPRTPPKYSFVFGRDEERYTSAFEVDVTKKFIRNRKGVRCFAYDPVQRKVLVADYPDDNATPPKHAPKIGGTKQSKPRNVGIKVGGGVGNVVPDAPREIVAVGGDGVHSEAGLKRLAERYWREMSRQELEGVLTTYVWDDRLFALRNGDRVEIKIQNDLAVEVLNRPDEATRVAFLQRYFRVNEQAAHVILAQARAQESTVFYLRQISHMWDTGEARSQLDFISIVEV